MGSNNEGDGGAALAATRGKEEGGGERKVWSLDVPRGILLVHGCHSPVTAQDIGQAIKLAPTRLSIVQYAAGVLLLMVQRKRRRRSMEAWSMAGVIKL
jgi:hypothetical protein